MYDFIPCKFTEACSMACPTVRPENACAHLKRMYRLLLLGGVLECLSGRAGLSSFLVLYTSLKAGY